MKADLRFKRSVVTALCAAGLSGALGCPGTDVVDSRCRGDNRDDKGRGPPLDGHWTYVAQPKPGHWSWTWEYACSRGYTTG